jgi:hypothetical protein
MIEERFEETKKRSKIGRSDRKGAEVVYGAQDRFGDRPGIGERGF